MKVTKNLTEGNISKNLFLYALPLILSSVLSQTYSMVDGIIAGKFISEHALGAISATGSFETLFNSLMSGFAAGFSIYISQLFGKKRFSDIKRGIVSMSIMIGGISLLFSVFSVLFRNPILDYLKVDDILRDDAMTYFTIHVMGYVIIFLNSLLVNALHALGITSFSFYVSLLSALLNIGGNLFSVLVLRLGVAGLALSTLLSALAASVVYIVMLRKAFREMECEDISYRFDFACVRRSMQYSLPTAIQQLAFHGIGFLIAPAINSLGAAATTGYNIANRIYSMGTMCLWAATSAFACYTGQCIGEGNTEKIRRGRRVGLFMNVLLVLPFVLVIMALAGPIVSVFFPEGYTGEAYTHAVRYARVYLPFIYIQLIGHFLHAYMRSLGRVPTVLGITIVGGVTRWVMTLLLVPVMHLEGVFVGQIISWGIDAIISVALYCLRYRTDAHLTRVIEKLRLHG